MGGFTLYKFFQERMIKIAMEIFLAASAVGGFVLGLLLFFLHPKTSQNLP